MAVFRVERTRDYTVMCNHHLKDSNLSLKAKGLLSMMLSLPDEWNYTHAGWRVKKSSCWGPKAPQGLTSFSHPWPPGPPSGG